uniref:Uncharacterized protein n=1 Tax=Arundo donax TaxID=35708 RepID=A0A0A9B7K3_ARUDO
MPVPLLFFWPILGGNFGQRPSFLKMT